MREVSRTEWRPHQGPQEYALLLPDNTFETLYGGARGGGKTDAGLAWIGDPADNPLYRGLVIRKNADDLADWVDRVIRFYPDASVAYRPAVIRFKSGAVVRTGHLKDANAYGKYQGQEYQRILIEELTQIPTLKLYLQLISSARSTVPGLSPQVFCTTNPGGIGHVWVKKRWMLDEAGSKRQPLLRFRAPMGDGSKQSRIRVFIPSTIDDNPTLMVNDPDYVASLEALAEADPDLYKAWRHGDWDIFAGQAFREWNPLIHTYTQPEFSLNICRKYMCFDWGYAEAGVCNWHAITPENSKGVQRVYLYRELTQTQKNPREWAQSLKTISQVDGVKDIYLPHDCFNKENGDSIADIFARDGGLRVFPMHTLERGARLNRKALMHAALQMAPDGKPYFQAHVNCKGFIENLPALVYDEKNPEDIDTRGPDHWYDATTGGLLMEAPTFGHSGSVDRLGKAKAFPRTFAPTETGAMQTVDFWQKFKDEAANPKRTRIW